MRDVWIDTDPAIGVPKCDVDDGLALIQAFHSPELCIRGVSAVFGNAPLSKAFPIAREIVERFGPPGLSVYAGASAATDLGRSTDATRALASALEERRTTILALGPVTNVATLLQQRPELASRIESIVVVAARRPGQRFFSCESQPIPFPDFNFECDPDGMRVLLDSPPPLVFAPWELSSHVWITGEDLDRLARESASGTYVAESARSWLALWETDLQAPGFNPFDTLAVGVLTHPDWVEGFDARVWIEEGAPDRPAVEADGAAAPRLEERKPYLVADASGLDRPGARPARYCFRPRTAFKEMLLERLAREAPGRS